MEQISGFSGHCNASSWSQWCWQMHWTAIIPAVVTLGFITVWVECRWSETWFVCFHSLTDFGAEVTFKWNWLYSITVESRAAQSHHVRKACACTQSTSNYIVVVFNHKVCESSQIVPNEDPLLYSIILTEQQRWLKTQRLSHSVFYFYLFFKCTFGHVNSKSNGPYICSAKSKLHRSLLSV